MAHEGLNADDPGIHLLAEAVAEVRPSALALVCCGSLPGVGRGATRLVSDVREQPEAGERCVPFSFAVDDGRGDAFDAAVVWPRAHLGKDFSLACLARGALLLRPGGRLLCAARKNKGGASLASAIGELVGEVEILARDRGYNLYVGVRRAEVDRAAAAALLGVRYAIDDPLLGAPPLVATPGVFCRKHLDQGTRALIERAAELADRGELGEPARILDLCAGIGPLALWAAQRWPAATISAIESNLLACACLRENAATRGLGGRIEVLAQDGLGDTSRPADLALINPPTHAGEEELRALLAPLPRALAGGVALFVVNRHGRLLGLLDELGARSAIHAVPGFSLVSARW